MTKKRDVLGCYRRKKKGNPWLEYCFSKCYLFLEFRMKYFMDIEIPYEKLYRISNYCPISNSNVNIVIIDMNNEESSTDSDSSNEVYNINCNINWNNIINYSSSHSDSENRNANDIVLLVPTKNSSLKNLLNKIHDWRYQKWNDLLELVNALHRLLNQRTFKILWKSYTYLKHEPSTKH